MTKNNSSCDVSLIELKATLTKKQTEFNQYSEVLNADSLPLVWREAATASQEKVSDLLLYLERPGLDLLEFGNRYKATVDADKYFISVLRMNEFMDAKEVPQVTDVDRLNYSELGKLRQAVREDMRPYYDTNDLAHLLDHADLVCDDLMVLLVRNRAGAKHYRMGLVAAYCHDMFSKQDKEFRRDHHERAFDFVMAGNTPWLQEFTQAELTQIACACREHRASWTGGYSSTLSRYVAAADRGKPDLDAYLHRAFVYGIDSLGMDAIPALVRSFKHVYSKFGKDGRVNTPAVWEETYSAELGELKERLEELAVLLSEVEGVGQQADLIAGYLEAKLGDSKTDAEYQRLV